MALKDCKTLFEMAKRDYGYEMTILDIGGGFPGETHSLWNPAKVRCVISCPSMVVISDACGGDKNVGIF